MATPLHESETHRTTTHNSRARSRNSLLDDASQGNKGALLSSLDAGAAVDEMDISRMTPLMHAAKNGHVDCVRLLIRRGADAQEVR